MLRKQQYVAKELTKKAMQMRDQNDVNEVKLFCLSGCSYYIIWTKPDEISFGSGEVEIIVKPNMKENFIMAVFESFLASRFNGKIEYRFDPDVKTMCDLKEFNSHAAEWM